MRTHAIPAVLASLALAFMMAMRTDAAMTTSDKVVVGYYGDWESATFPPTSIPFSQITNLNYAFALMTSGSVPTLGTPDLLAQTVSLAHSENVSVSISIGGWTGSQAMSVVAASNATRQAFVTQTVAWVSQYRLDGIDIDWEYPGQQGLECNTVDSANDTPNFLLLLQDLRSALDAAFSPPVHKLLTIAVATQPFFQNGSPISSTSAFASVIDWIFIMAYDIYQQGTTTGPNAPLSIPSKGGQPYAFAQGIDSWAASGMPEGKMVMGLPLYGYATTSKVDMSAGGNMIVDAETTVPMGDSDDSLYADPCPSSPKIYSGVWKWTNLRTQQLLLNATTPTSAWTWNWDSTSQTPWLYNSNTSVFLTYDDPRSLGAKVAYARCRGVLGVGVWELSQDYYDAGNGTGELMEAVDGIWEQGQGTCNLQPYPESHGIGVGTGYVGTATKVKAEAGKVKKWERWGWAVVGMAVLGMMVV